MREAAPTRPAEAKADLSRRAALGLLGGGLLAAVSPAAWAQDRLPPAPDDGWRPPPPDRELMVPVRGGRIYVRVNGPLTGPRPPVVVAHGGPGGSHASNLPALRLAGDRAVILYDQLDCGRSDRPGDPRNWVVERFVSEVDAIRAALDLQRLHFVGHSWGSTIGLEYAARRPSGLASLVLEGPYVSTSRWIADAYRLRTALPLEVNAALIRGEQAKRYDTPEYKAAEAAFYAAYNSRVRRPEWLRAYVRDTGTTGNDKLYRTMWGPNEFVADGTLHDYNGEHLLPLIAAPTLFLCGRFDEGTPEAAADFAERVRNARVQVVENASHAIQVERPIEYASSLRRFLAANDG
ncbi:MAG: proline iminopeptidase-family hydrolase [Pseudomonadota bacterium]|nr:proline iminopeptidase-family hydrolase [Pseudomonadota bacterium]